MNLTTEAAPSANNSHAPRRTSPRSNHLAARIVQAAKEEATKHHHAELFYLQKQIQQRTSLVFVLEDGSHLEGYVEWYDTDSIKIRSKSPVLLYKDSIKYIYKAGDHNEA